MITETGIVTTADTATAWVRTTRSSACEACSSRNSCTAADNNHKEMIVTVKNTLNVSEGDTVVIGLDTRPMLYISFLLYVFPIILLIAGAFIGEQVAHNLKINPTITSILSGFFLFGVSFFVIRKKNNSLSQNNAYKPFLVRKKPHAAPGCRISS